MIQEGRSKKEDRRRKIKGHKAEGWLVQKKRH